MFKHILLLSAVLALAQCQPVPEDESPFNIKNPCSNCIQSGANAISSAVSQASSRVSNAGNHTVGAVDNAVGEATDATGAASQLGSQAVDTVGNISSQATGAASQFGTHVTNTVSQITSQVQQQHENKKVTLGQIIKRLGEAAKLTIIEEKESITKALKSIQAATGQTFQAGLDTAKTGFDIILIVPKFALNALGIHRPSTLTL